MNIKRKLSKTTERANIANFITKLSGSDFSNANKYLNAIIENKLLRKINNFKSKPLF